MPLIDEWKGTIAELPDAMKKFTERMRNVEPKNLSAVNATFWPPEGEAAIEMYDTPLKEMHHDPSTLAGWADTFEAWVKGAHTVDPKEIACCECAMSPGGSGRTQAWPVEEESDAETAA